MYGRLPEFSAAYTWLSSGCEHCGVIGLSPGKSKTRNPVQRLKHLRFQRYRMLSHLLRPQLEADAAHKGAQFLPVLRFNRARNKLLWATFVASVLLAFIVTLISVALSTRHVPASPWIYVGIAVATVIVALGEHFRTDLAFLNRQTRNAFVSWAKLSVRTKSDFLFLHTLTAYVFVVTPALLSVLLLAILSTGMERPGTTNYTSYADVLKQLITFTGTLLVAQIALFNFMFGQLLGRYSSQIAVAVSKHRVVRLLRGYLIVFLAGLYAFYLVGFPDALPKVALLLALSLAACLGITVWASNTGIRIDSAILYMGHQGAERIARWIKPPILTRTRFWNTMADLGLDWRTPERMVVTLPPREPASAATTLVSGLFNAAHKSIQENQHETFWSSIVALSFIVQAYVKRRRQYLGSTDSLLAYLNDQLAALAKAATKSPNEYMVTNTVTTIGVIGALALEVGRGPDLRNAPKAPEMPYSESHPYFSHWQALLGECFELTHGLMRTTAASEVLTQLTKLTKKAIDLGYAEDASMSFPSELSRMYATCLTKRTPYHLSLAGQCVTAVMEVWSYGLGRQEAAVGRVNKSMCDTIKKMALAFQAVEKLPTFDLRDPATTLTCKFSEEQITLQDIALSILTRPVKDQWQRRLAVADFEQLFDLVSDLLKDATAQEFFENKLTDTVKHLIPLHYRSKMPVLDWEHKLFSIIGMAAAIYNETGRESARLLALEAISCYRDVLFDALQKNERVHDDSWDYLQLTSVWAGHLLKDVALADALVDAVANGRPFHLGMFSVSGKHGWGLYGYPNVSLLNSDFSIPYPRYIGHRLSETVTTTVKRWQEKLMNPDELRDTYERIEKIREPIRKRIHERYKEEKEKDKEKRRPEKPDSK